MKKKTKTIGHKFNSLKKRKEKEAIEFYKKLNQYSYPIPPYQPPKKEVFMTRLSDSSEELPTF